MQYEENSGLLLQNLPRSWVNGTQALIAGATAEQIVPAGQT
jgi:hypothetical protein